MDKMRDIEKYIDTVKSHSDFFKKYYFHSLIDLNLTKLDSILHHGILSKNLIQQKCLPSLFTHDGRDFDSKNGNTYVSLTQYTNNCEFSTMFESFSLHTLTCLSLLVNKSINVEKQGERETFFDDELFCLDSISNSNLEGIILPEHLSTLLISEVNCLPNDLFCYSKSYLDHWIECMQRYFNTALPYEVIVEIKASHGQLWDILEEYENPDRWVQSAIRTQRDQYGKDLKDVLANILQNLWSEKFDISNPIYIDVLMRVNDNQLPVYEIKQKGLKRVI